MMSDINQIKAWRVVQGSQEFLLSVVTVAQLMRYTRYTERVVTNFDEEGRPEYNPEIQRKTDRAKVNQIADYLLNDPEALFPTNLVLAVPDGVIIDFKEEGDQVVVTLDPIVADQLKAGDKGDVYISVIDGQHRLKGLEIAVARLQNAIHNPEIFLTPTQQLAQEKKLEQFLNFQIAVSFFRGPVLEYQASIFSIINRTQTKVSEGLVYNLFGLSKADSPQKTALEVSLALNAAPGSPFRKHIRLVGFNYVRGTTPPLSQAAVVKSIILCISPSIRKSEVERFLPRSDFKAGITRELCFRRFYAYNEDSSISKILFAYFKAVQTTFMDAHGKPLWQSEKTDNILNTTVGYEAMLLLLKRLILKVSDNQLFDIETYQELLQPLEGQIEFSNFSLYPKTSISRKKLLEDMVSVLEN